MIPSWAFLSKEKRVKRYKPEKTLTLMPYNKEKWMKYFGVSDSRLQMSNVGAYSIAKPHMGEQLIKFIHKHIKNTSNICATETHGGLGGFSMVLAKIFKKVNSVEIEPLHANIIKNNAKVFNIKNIKVCNKDYMDVIDQLDQDVIISDPPWGGLDYYKKEHISLGINNVNIIHFINELAKQDKFTLFILLVPQNYDFNEFIHHLSPSLLPKVCIEYVDAAHPHHIFIGIKK